MSERPRLERVAMLVRSSCRCCPVKSISVMLLALSPVIMPASPAPSLVVTA